MKRGSQLLRFQRVGITLPAAATRGAQPARLPGAPTARKRFYLGVHDIGTCDCSNGGNCGLDNDDIYFGGQYP